VEGKRGVPRNTVSNPPRVLWFGHQINWQAMSDLLLVVKAMGAELTVVTAPSHAIAAELSYHGINHRLVAWSLPAMAQELDRCDLVVIPTSTGDFYACKSPNRVLEAIWAGRPVIAGSIPAYDALSAFASVGNVADDLRNLNLTGDLEAGQRYIESNHSWEGIGRQWVDAIMLDG
jgi:glycosyltransferase involved in cell wall biosynthesis